MKACYRIGIVLVWTCYFLLSGVMASSSYAIELIDRAHPSDTNVVYYNLTPPGDKGNYIKQFSAYGPEYGTDLEMLSKSSLDSYEKQLTEINQWTGKDGVKVYVLLINGLSTSHYNTVPDEANDVSKVLEWSKNKKTIQSNFNAELEKEAKQIIEKIAAQQASIVNGPSVFCSLIAYEVKYGESAPEKYQSKKVILYHSTAYGFSDTDNYLKVLDASIASSAATKGSIEVGKNMDLLIESIRFSVQADLKAKVDGKSLQTLSEKLYATHSKMEISRCIDTLSKNLMHAFDNPLREHVVRVLLSFDEANGSASGNVTVYSKVFNAGKNAITVLDNIDDVNIDSWYTYINSTQRGDRTTIQLIAQTVPRGIFGEADYDAFTKMISRQILHYKRFGTEKTELLTREDKTDHLIAWDNSYVMKFFATAPINTNSYVIKLEPTGKLKLTKSRVTKWDYYPNIVYHSGGISSQVGERPEAHWEEETPLLLEPFELVAFINRSDLSLFASKEATTGKLLVLPAIHLLYAQEKKIVNIIGDGISIASDVACIFPPIAEITYGPVWVRRFIYGVELSDKISSYMSLSATLGVGGNDFKDIADAYGAIQDYMSHGVLVYGIANAKVVRDMANYVYKVSQREKELTTLAVQSEEIRYALEIKNNIDREAKALKGEDWVEKYRTVIISNVHALQAGKVVSGGKNLAGPKFAAGLFRPLGNKKNPMKAGDFWRNTGDQINHYISEDAKYYIKHNTETGQLLFLKIDQEPVSFLGYGIDEGKLIKGDYAKLLQNLKTIHGLPGGSTSITIGGEVVQLSRDKANIILGKYGPNNVPGISGETGTEDVISELTVLKNYSYAEPDFSYKPGSVCILNIPRPMYADRKASFFDDFNKDFLDGAIKNKDQVNIVFVSDPRKADLLEEYASDNKTFGVFTNKPSGLGNEVRYLRDRGVTIVKFKDGTSIDLTQIDLSKLDWSDWKY